MPSHPEVLLISAVLRQGDHVTPMHGGISNAHFHIHKMEWTWIERFVARYRKTPDRSSFKAKFPSFSIKAVNDVAHFTEEVRKEHARFMLTEMMDSVIDMVEADEIEKAVDVMMSGAIKVQGSLQGDSGHFSLLESHALIYDEVRRRVESVSKRGMSGVPTGFATLDGLTGGVQEGDLWIVAARLGHGKTWALNTMALAAMSNGFAVQYNALEQTKAQIAFRMHTLMSAKYGKQVFRSSDLMRGKGFDLKAYKEFVAGLEKLGVGNLFVSDASRGRITPMTMAAQIELTKPDLVMLDYIQISGTDKDWQTLAKLSGELKLLAVRYGIGLVCAAQINRTGVGKAPPGTESIAGADDIARDADVVVTMAQQTDHVSRMRLAKSRNSQGEVLWYVEFDPARGLIREVSGNIATALMDKDAEDQDED